MTSNSPTFDSNIRADNSSALFRLSRTSISNTPQFTATQAQIDSGVTHFLEESAHFSTFACILAGGGASRLARGGILAMGANATGRGAWAIQGLASMGSLGAEVVAFDGMGRALSSVSGEGVHNPNLWRWDGQGGFRQGLFSSAITFTAFRGAGWASQGQNIVFQHFAQSTAMVAGHNVAGALNIIPGPEGSLAEQYFEAERTNISLGAGMGFLHSMAPGIHAFERSLDLANQSRGRIRQVKPVRNEENPFGPQAVAVGPESSLAGEARESPLRDPRRNPNLVLSEMKGDGSGAVSRDRELLGHLRDRLLEGDRPNFLQLSDKNNLRSWIEAHAIALSPEAKESLTFIVERAGIHGGRVIERLPQTMEALEALRLRPEEIYPFLRSLSERNRFNLHRSLQNVIETAQTLRTYDRFDGNQRISLLFILGEQGALIATDRGVLEKGLQASERLFENPFAQFRFLFDLAEAAKTNTGRAYGNLPSAVETLEGPGALFQRFNAAQKGEFILRLTRRSGERVGRVYETFGEAFRSTGSLFHDGKEHHEWFLKLTDAFYDTADRGFETLPSLIERLQSTPWTNEQRRDLIFQLASYGGEKARSAYQALPAAIDTARALYDSPQESYGFLSSLAHRSRDHASQAYQALPRIDAAAKKAGWNRRVVRRLFEPLMLGQGETLSSSFVPLPEALEVTRPLFTGPFTHQRFFLRQAESGHRAGEIFEALPEAVESLKRAGFSNQQTRECLELLLEKSGIHVDRAYSGLYSAVYAFRELEYAPARIQNLLSMIAERTGSHVGRAFRLLPQGIQILRGRGKSPPSDPESLLETLRDILLLKLSTENDDYTGWRDVEQVIADYALTAPALVALSPPRNMPELLEAMQNIPTGRPDKINRLRRLAARIADQMKSPEYYPIHRQIHNHPSRGNIDLVNRILERAERDLPADHWVLPQLREALNYLHEIYDNRLDLTEARTSLSTEALRTLEFPSSNTPTLEEVSTLAVSVRRTWERGASLSAEDKIGLTRLAISLQKFAFAQCDVAEVEFTSEGHAHTMAALISVLYGSGYGNEGWLEVARRLESLSRHGEEPRLDRELRLYSALAREMALQVQDHYHDHLDPLILSYGQAIGIKEKARSLFTSNQYRPMAVFQLGQHLERLGIPEGHREAARSVLQLLSFDQPPPDLLRMRPRFYDDADFPQDPRVAGGKGLGLSWLTSWAPDHVPLGFILPPQTPDYRLNHQDRVVIRGGIEGLERRTRRRLGEGLSVSVRSGGAVSMPGTMETRLNLGSFEEIERAIVEVYQSWNNDAARAFRLRNGIPDDWGTAVNIVAMVDGTRDAASGSGVASSSVLSETNVKIVYGRQVSGARLVDGSHDGRDPLPNARLQEELETHLRDFERRFGAASGFSHPIPIEVEFTVESGRLFFLQIRRAHFTYEEGVQWYARRVREGLISREAAVSSLGGAQTLRRGLQPISIVDPSAENPVLSSGNAGLGPAVAGRIAFSSEQIAMLMRNSARAIYVTDDPDAASSAEGALKTGAALVNGGNPLSHLVGIAKTTPNLSYLNANFRIAPGGILVFPGERAFRSGVSLTLDPRNGRIYEGEAPLVEAENPVAGEIRFLLGN